MSSYDEEIRVAIIATAEGVQAGTAQATASLNEFNAQLQAAQAKAAASYTASNDAFVAAQTRAGQLLAEGQRASSAQIIASYDALNIARDANLANAQAYLAAMSAAQLEALNIDDFAANAAIQSMQAQVVSEQAAATAAYENAAAQLEQAGAMDVNAASTDADTAAELENAGAKTINRGATIGLTEAVAGLARGNIGMAAYGMSRMSISSGFLSAVMSPLGLTIAAVTGSIVALGAAAVVGSVHEQELEGALLATGNQAGLTVGQLQRLSSTLASGDTTVGDARDAILALARSGEYSGQSFRDAAQAVVDFASLTGQSTAQAAKYVESLAHATTQSLIKANEQYHFLTLAQFTNIENLRKQGKESEATEAIVDAFYAHMHTGAQQAVKDEGYIARGWDDVKRSVSGALNAVEQWGAQKSITDQIAALQSTLARGGEVTDSGFIAYSKAYVASLDSQIAHLKALQAQKEQNASSDAAANTATDNAIKAKYGAGVHPPKAHHEHIISSHVHRETTASSSHLLAQDGHILAGLQRQADQRVRLAAQVNSINEGAARRHAQAMLQIHIEQLRTEEAQGKISHSQELADEQKLYANEYTAQLAAYQKELALENGKPAEIARINAEIEALNDAHLQKMTAAQEHAAVKQAAAYQKALQPIVGAFTTSINGIIQGTQTMQMALGHILDSILLKYLDVSIKSSIQWVASEAQKTMATEEGTVLRVALEEVASAKTLALKILTAGKTIAIDAAEAAAGAFKAMVGIPIVGPALAAAASAAAFIEVKNLAHFDVGAWNIPHDMPAMVHAGETILPRPFAEDFRKNGGMLGGGGETHVHLHGHSAGGLFTAHVDDLVAAIKGAHRTGAFA